MARNVIQHIFVLFASRCSPFQHIYTIYKLDSRISLIVEKTLRSLSLTLSLSNKLNIMCSLIWTISFFNFFIIALYLTKQQICVAPCLFIATYLVLWIDIIDVWNLYDLNDLKSLFSWVQLYIFFYFVFSPLHCEQGMSKKTYILKFDFVIMELDRESTSIMFQ